MSENDTSVDIVIFVNFDIHNTVLVNVAINVLIDIL